MTKALSCKFAVTENLNSWMPGNTFVCLESRITQTKTDHDFVLLLKRNRGNLEIYQFYR